MQKLRQTTLISVLSLMGALGYGAVGSAHNGHIHAPAVPSPVSFEAGRVQIQTNPPVGQMLPFEAEAKHPQTPVQFKLQAIAPNGQPLQNAKISLRLLTPPANSWLPTDFPLVEGTQLLEMQAIAPKGEVEFAQMLPIRGNYQLEVAVTPTADNAFAPFRQTLTLPVAEHEVKYRNLGILVVVLLGAGLGGGWVIGRQHNQPMPEQLSTQVRLLLSGAAVVAIAAMLVVNVSAEFAESHSHTHEQAHTYDPGTNSGELPSSVTQQNLELKILGHTHAVVGEPAQLLVQLRDRRTNQPVPNAEFEIQTTAIEGEWSAFSYRAIADANGQFAWQPQFFDGAPHRITVTARPQPATLKSFPPLQAAQTVEVEGVAPPLQMRLLVLGYFISLVLVGLATGFWWCQRQSRLDTKPAN